MKETKQAKVPAKPMLRPAFFLDRDGTINFDRIYINKPELIDLIPGAAAAIALANSVDYRVVVITNQSGIGRGLIEPEILPQIHRRLDQLLFQAAKARIDAYEFCPHRPEDNCSCRKPKTEMLTKAAERLHIDLTRSFFVGDSWVDVECARNAGCVPILVRTGKGRETERRYGIEGKGEFPRNGAIVDDLAAAVSWAFRN